MISEKYDGLLGKHGYYKLINHVSKDIKGTSGSDALNIAEHICEKAASNQEYSQPEDLPLKEDVIDKFAKDVSFFGVDKDLEDNVKTFLGERKNI